MRQIVIILGLMIVGCATSPTSSTPPQEVPPPEVVYKEVPGTKVIREEAEVIGTYDNAQGFGNAGIEIKEGGSFRRWKSGLWDSSQKVNYRNASWTFQDGVLTLDYRKGASRRVEQEVFDIVGFADRMFLVSVAERKDFIAKANSYQDSKASTDQQQLISIESLTGSYLSKMSISNP